MENDFFIKVVSMLKENSCYPKYQLERRIDIFFNLFLPEIIKHEFGNDYEVDFIIPELPIKNPNNNMSSNLDYFVVCNNMKTAFLVELKTDQYSCNPAQLIRYGKMLEDGFKKIMLDVRQIVSSTTSKYMSKYDYLQIILNAVSPDIELKLVYILPTKGKIRLEKVAEESDIEVHYISLEDLKRLKINGPYSEEWDILINSNLLRDGDC